MNDVIRAIDLKALSNLSIGLVLAGGGLWVIDRGIDRGMTRYLNMHEAQHARTAEEAGERNELLQAIRAFEGRKSAAQERGNEIAIRTTEAVIANRETLADIAISLGRIAECPDAPRSAR